MVEKSEEKRVNKFITNILNSDKRLATQLPGQKEHTIVIPMSVITDEWREMVKDLESMRDEETN